MDIYLPTSSSGNGYGLMEKNYMYLIIDTDDEKNKWIIDIDIHPSVHCHPYMLVKIKHS